PDLVFIERTRLYCAIGVDGLRDVKQVVAVGPFAGQLCAAPRDLGDDHRVCESVDALLEFDGALPAHHSVPSKSQGPHVAKDPTVVHTAHTVAGIVLAIPVLIGDDGANAIRGNPRGARAQIGADYRARGRAVFRRAAGEFELVLLEHGTLFEEFQ